MAATDDIIGGWIRNAEKTGEIQNLPGFGEPLDLFDDSQIPDEHRMTFRILKNAGIAPPEIAMFKEVSALKGALEHQTDETTRQATLSKLREAQVKLDMALDRYKAVK